MIDEKTIVGRIPGYNTNIDADGVFEKELMKGLTFVDLYPTSFTDSADLVNAVQDVASASSSAITNPTKFFGEAVSKLFTSPGLVKTSPPNVYNNANIGFTSSDPSQLLFESVLTRMKASFGLSEDFDKAKAIRIVAANDSTFTETFTNAFDDENVIVSGFKTISNKINQTPVLSQMVKGAKNLDSMAMQNLIGFTYKNINNASGSSTLADLMAGAALGMNIAAPQLWSASQYNSTLTLFVKLVSPTGQPHCIRKNILEPLLYLLAAASPITSYGLVYGYPLMWQVNAQGITNFRIGSIAALSIIRGSFETTFTKALQPTVIDVRLTIIPLLSDFAVQTNAVKTGNIYDDDMAPFLGVQNPADIVRGTMNKGPMGGPTRSQEKPNIVSVKI